MVILTQGDKQYCDFLIDIFLVGVVKSFSSSTLFSCCFESPHLFWGACNKMINVHANRMWEAIIYF